MNKNLSLSTFLPSIIWMILTLPLVGYIIFSAVNHIICENHFKNAYYYEQKKAYQLADVYYQKTEEKVPWEAYYTYQRGKNIITLASTKKQKLEMIQTLNTAIKILNRAQKIEKKSPWIDLQLTRIYDTLFLLTQNQSYKKLTLSSIKTAYEKDPRNPIFVLNYAKQLHRTGQLDEASKYYELAKTQDRLLLEAYYWMGQI